MAQDTDCPLCRTGVENVCMPYTNCSTALNIEDSCQSSLTPADTCNQIALLTNPTVVLSPECRIAFNAYYQGVNDV